MKQELDYKQRFDIMYREGLDRNWFDEIVPEEVRKYLTRISAIKPMVKKNPSLDLGCGRGQLLGYLEQEGFIRVIGVDVSEVAASAAKQHTGRSEVMVADAIDLPFNDYTFSLVTELTLLSSLHLQYWLAILNEIYRVLDRGGFYISEVFSRDRSCDINKPLVTRSVIPSELDQVYGVTKDELFNIFGRRFSIKRCLPINPESSDSFFVLAQKL